MINLGESACFDEECMECQYGDAINGCKYRGPEESMPCVEKCNNEIEARYEREEF